MPSSTISLQNGIYSYTFKARMILSLIFLFILSANTQCTYFNLTNSAQGMSIPARTQELILEILPPELEINEVVLTLNPLIATRTANLISLHEMADLDPLMRVIKVKNCNQQKGNYQIIVGAIVYESNTNTDKIVYSTRQSIEGYFLQQNDANRLAENLNVLGKTTLTAISPTFMSILSTDTSASKYNINKAKLLSKDGYLANIKINVQNGDYKKPHSCVFFQTSKRGEMNTKQVKVQATFQGQNVVICKVPTTFTLIGTLQVSMQVDSIYTNFLQIESHEFQDISEISPLIIHGKQSQLDIVIQILKPSTTILPTQLKMLIDSTYYEAIKIDNTGTLDKYVCQINTPFVTKLTSSSNIKFSFNQQDFFMSDKQLTYMADMIISDLSPKTADIFSTIEARLYIQQLNVNGEYWCDTNDDQLVKGVIKTIYLSEYSIDRTYLFCTLKPQVKETKIFITVIANSGTYRVTSQNYIQYKGTETETAISYRPMANSISINNNPVIDGSYYIDEKTSYTITIELNDTLSSDKQYYCMFYNSKLKYFTYFTEQLQYLYECETPLLEQSTTEVSVQIVDNDGQQVLTDSEPIINLTITEKGYNQSHNKIYLEAYQNTLYSNESQVDNMDYTLVINKTDVLYKYNGTTQSYTLKANLPQSKYITERIQYSLQKAIYELQDYQIIDNGKYVRLLFKDSSPSNYEQTIKCLVNNYLVYDYSEIDQTCDINDPYLSDISSTLSTLNITLIQETTLISNNITVHKISVIDSFIDDSIPFMNKQEQTLVVMIEGFDFKYIKSLKATDLRLYIVIDDLSFKAFVDTDCMESIAMYETYPRQISAVKIKFTLPSDCLLLAYKNRLLKSSYDVNLRLFNDQVIFQKGDNLFSDYLLKNKKFYNQLIIDSIYYLNDQLSIVLENHIAKEMFHKIDIKIVISGIKELYISCQDPQMTQYLDFDDRSIKISNLKTLLDFDNYDNYYYYHQDLIISLYHQSNSSHQISLNKYSYAVQLLEQAFVNYNYTVNCTSPTYDVHDYNYTYSNTQIYNKIQQTMEPYQTQSFDTFTETTNKTLLKAEDSSNDSDQTIQTLAIDAISPNSILFRESGFSHLFKIRFNTSVDLDTVKFSDSYCEITTDIQVITSQYIYFTDSTTLYCYFVFEYGDYFIDGKELITSTVKVVSNQFSSEKSSIILIKDVTEKTISEVIYVDQNSNFTFGVSGNFTANLLYSQNAFCFFKGYITSSISIINSTYGECELKYIPMVDTNISLYIIYDKDQIYLKKTPEYIIVYQRTFYEQTASLRSIDKSLIPLYLNKTYLTQNQSIPYSTTPLFQSNNYSFVFVEGYSYSDVLLDSTVFSLSEENISINSTRYPSYISTLQQLAQTVLPSYNYTPTDYLISVSEEINKTSNINSSAIVLNETGWVRNETLHSLLISQYERMIEQDVISFNYSFETIQDITNSLITIGTYINYDQYLTDNQTIAIYKQTQSTFFSQFLIMTNVYGRLTPIKTEDPSIKYFQARLYNVYSNFQKFATQTWASTSSATVSTVPLATSISALAQSNRIVNFFAISQQIFYSASYKDHHIIIEAESLPSDVPIKLILRFQQSVSPTYSVKSTNQYTLSAYQIYNSTHAVFIIPPGISTGIYKCSLNVNYVDSQQSFPIVVLSNILKPAHISSITPQSKSLSEVFNGPINITFSSFEMPMISTLQNKITVLSNIYIGCKLVLNSNNDLTIVEGTATQISEERYQCNVNLNNKSKITRAVSSDSYYIDAVLQFYINYNTIQNFVIIDINEIKIVKQPQLLQLYNGRNIIKGESNAQIKFSMSNYVSSKSFCKINGEVSLIEYSSGIYYCNVIITTSNDNNYLYISNNLDNPYSPDVLSNSNWVMTSVYVNTIETDFFKASPSLTMSQYHIQTGQPEIITLFAKYSYINFNDFGSLLLTCRFYNVNDLTKVSYSVSCRFIKSSLDQISVYLKPFALDTGDYYMQFVLDSQFESPIHEAYQIHVFLNPSIDSVYPQNFIFTNRKDTQNLYVIGDNFDTYTDFESNLYCKLNFQEQSSTNYASFLTLKATILSDTLLKCLFENKHQQYVSNNIKAPKLQFQITLQFQNKDIVFRNQNDSANLIYSVLPINLIFTEPNAISITSSQVSSPIQVFTTKSTIINEVSNSIADTVITCIFFEQNNPNNKIAASNVQSITYDYLPTQSLIECETPIISSTNYPYQMDNLDIAIQLDRTPLVYTSYLESQSLTISQNKVKVNLMPLPQITNTDPNIIYNLASIKYIAISGYNFKNSKNLHCIINTNYYVKAQYESDNKVFCDLKGVKLSGTTLSIAITNDNGVTQGNTYSITIVKNIPQIKTITSPTTLYTNTKHNLILTGTYLNSLASLSILILQNEYQQQVYCNTTSSTETECYEAYFPKIGSYQVYVVPDLDQRQRLKSQLKLSVSQFVQTQYVTTTTPTSTTPTTTTVKYYTVVKQISNQLIQKDTVITITGMNFDSSLEYYIYPRFQTNVQAYFTKATYLSTTSLEWTFSNIQSSKMADCGQIIAKDSEGSTFQAISPSHIEATTLCYLNDFEVESLSLTQFPLGFSSGSYEIQLKLSNDTYYQVFQNSFLFGFVTSIELQYEGLGTQTCSFQSDLAYITCPVQDNAVTTIPQVRLLIIINVSFKFSVSQLFSYYNYLTITSISPSTSITHLEDKEVIITGTNFVNTNKLYCIIVGDNISKIKIPAIYISSTELKCPLTSYVFENTQATFHITLNPQYFEEVNQTSSGITLTVIGASLTSIDVSTLHPSPAFDVATINSTMQSSYQTYVTTQQTLLKSYMDAIVISSVDKTKLLAGPWLSQFTLSLSGMTTSQDLAQDIRCMITLLVTATNTLRIYSDNHYISNTYDSITCFFKKEIIKEGSFCIEFSLKSSGQYTSTCQKEIYVYHVPTIYSVQTSLDIPNEYINTNTIGYYLDNYSTQWFCFWFFYEDDLNFPFKIDYDSIAATELTANKKIECKLSYLLQFYTVIQQIEANGITNLQDYFYNKTVKSQNIALSSLFIQSHLVSLVDVTTFSYSGSSDNIQETVLNQRLDIIYHSGDYIGVSGYFMNNTVNPVSAKLTYAQDLTVIKYTTVCSLISEILLKCQLPSTFTDYGDYLISIYDTIEATVISDENILSLVILPKPTISTVTYNSYVQSQTETGESILYTIQYVVTLSTASDAEYLDYYKQIYQEDVRCLIGDDKVQIDSNTTWISDYQLECSISNFYSENVECVELSINRGKTYTSSCQQTIISYRAPYAYSFTPTYTLLRNSLTITITGSNFNSANTYTCLFYPKYSDVSSYTASDNFTYEATATFVSTTQLTCVVPTSKENSTHSFAVALFYKGHKVIHFSESITYLDYIELISVAPVRGTKYGGTPITLQINNLPLDYSGYIPKCLFSFAFLQTGTTFTVTATAINDTHIQCNAPDVSAYFSDATDIYLDIYITVNDLDGVYRKQQSLVYTYINDYTLTSVFPTNSYVNQGPTIYLYGTNILNVHSLLVKLVVTNTGHTVYFKQDVLYINSTLLIFIMPSAKDFTFETDRSVKFYLSLNDGVDWTDENIVFTFYDDPQMTKLSQNNCNLKGNVAITVYGINFRNDITYCLFGLDNYVAPTSQTTTSVTCTAPAQASSSTQRMMLLVSDNYVVSSAYLYFYFEDTTQINSVSPSEGYIAGGNTVTISGNFTVFYNDAFLLYCGTYAITSFVSITDTTIKVNMPTVTEALSCIIKFEYDGLTYSNDTVYYTYKTYSTLSAIWPDFGPTMGGTIVAVSGSSFDDDAYCYLDGEQIKPIIISTTLILCQTPEHKEATLDFELSFSTEQVYSTSTGLSFTYYNDIQINSVDPAYISMYAGTNGVIITINGNGFMNTPQLMVRVNEVLITPTFISTKQLTFPAQDVIQDGSYYVFVSNNGQDFQRGSSTVTLNYYKLLGLISLSVTKIEIGNSMDITVSGYNFPTSGTFYCVLGRSTAYYYYIQAQLDTTTQMVCTVPSYSTVLTTLTAITFSASYNLQEFYGDLQLYYYPAVTITDFNDKEITQSQSYIVLTVDGSNFINTAEETTCIIEDSDGDQTKAFNILFVSSSQMICSFDMVDAGDYSLLVSNNGIQFATFTTQLKVLDAFQVLSVEPMIVMSQNVNQVVYVEVNNIFTGCQCLFEIITSDYQIVSQTRDIVSGDILNSHLIVCKLPDYSEIGSALVNVRIIYNSLLKSQSKSSVLLTVVDKCPPGYGCSGYRIIDCPKGFFCIGGGISQTPRPCPIGYYQDKMRSKQCKHCPKGQMCPFSGMESPIICPPGFICDREKLNSPAKECPKGSYCFNGTQSDDILNGLIDKLPYMCTRGSYCRVGMKTGIVGGLQNYSNSSAPGVCKQGMICYVGSEDVGGVGSCPAGYFCPKPNATGIICPPRHYCPDRGNTKPIKCPKGTFNMFFGQKNCTNCTFGRYCPLEGMFMPFNCPPGFVCNKEASIFPQDICKVGHICLGGVMSGTEIKKRSCHLVVSIGGSNPCKYGAYYKKTIDSSSMYTSYYYNYFYNEDVCCFNYTETATYFSNMGSSIGADSFFSSYSYQINNTYSSTTVSKQLWDGMRIVKKAYLQEGLTTSDYLLVPIRKHRKFILTHFYMMYTNYQQKLCPGGYLCLEGVYTTTADSYLISTPFNCPLGSYCLKGSDSVIGTALCPVGYYCPEKTEIPIAAAQGTYTGAAGATEAQQCQPGTFASGSKSSGCTQCPNGYQCKDKGTSMPTICPMGYYRSITESNVCSACPKGTFSFERGARDQLECLECPPGRICENEATTNISSSIGCTDGQVCPSGSGAQSTVNCPAGFYCLPETTEDTMYSYLCEAGFFCKEGTGNSTRNRDTCPQSYFCPPGTGEIDMPAGAQNDYSTWATDPPTRCPYGTGSDGEDTKTKIQQCGINEGFKLLKSDLDVRVSETTTNSSSSRLLSDERSGGRNLYGRYLATSIASKDDPLLKDLYEIDYVLGDLKDGVETTSTIKTWINSNRKYITRWCPLNMSLVSEYIEIEKLSEDALETNVPNLIFELPPSSYALITMDWRHIRDESYEWTYGEDYAISFTIAEDLTIDDESLPITMPEQFLSNKTDKSQVLEFTVFSMEYTRLRVDVLLYNSLFLNYKYLFINSTSVEIRYPNRADYGTQKSFITSLVNEYQISLPLNIPKLLSDKDSMPSHLVSFSYSQSDWSPIMHQSTKNRNIFIPSSLYWGTRDRINLPYLPYFSNCKGYGKYIPFWALMEQNSACNLIPYNETVWMSEYSFGKKPTADTCEQVQITCIYDEIIGTSQPLTRWFEVSAETSIFDITVDPALYQDSVSREYDSTEVLNVAPQFEGDNTGQIPKNITLILSYYQVDNNLKRIIIVELDYDQFEEATEAEANGTDQVVYNLTFYLDPLSHKDLTINFAFSWRFYVVLYLLVGMIAVIIISIFVIYHRIASRPPNGQTFAKFKFISYLKLTIYPALYGMFLALVPLVVGNFFISVFIAGHFLTIKTNIFACDDPAGDSACIYTLFDTIKDNPNNVDLDYASLRTGRTGTSMIVMGAYLALISLSILIPDKSDQYKGTEAHDGNIWEYYTWKRSNMMFISTFLLFFELGIIQFSFSPSYGENVWVMIGIMKVVQILVEVMIEKAIEEILLISPLSVSIGVMQGLITFGASNFLDFLNGFFIEVGIQMFERPYLEKVVEFVQLYLEYQIPKIYRALVRWFNNEDELAEKRINYNQIGVQPDAVQQPVAVPDPVLVHAGVVSAHGEVLEESSRSEIFYSDDSSFESKEDEDGLDDNPNIFLHQQNNNDSEVASIDLSHEVKILKDKKSAKEKEDQKKKEKEELGENKGTEKNEDEEEENDGFQDYDEFDKKRNESGNEEDIKLDQDVETQLVEPLLDVYVGYANDTLSLLYQPFFTGLLWIFYDETIVASLYGIKIQDFVYYFLFNIVIIPFTVTIDILFHNLLEWYHGLPIHDYLDYLAFRFKTRKTRWKGNEQANNNQIADNLQSLDQLCFSSQYFFVVTLYMSGLNQILLGIQILLWAKTYNIFADFGTLPLIGFMIALCIIVHRLCIWFGKLFKVWKIDETMEKLERGEDELTINELFMKIYDPEKFKFGYRSRDGVKFDPKKWKLVDRIKLEEEQNRQDLMTDRVVANTFREMFMKYNKPWLQEQIHEVFTPRTLFLFRKEIIDQFRRVMGDIEPDLTDSQEEEDDSHNRSENSILGSDDYEDKSKKKKRFVPTKEELDWVKANDKPITRAVIKYWILRARFKQKITIQVNRIINQAAKQQCLYCQATFGLKVEVIQNIEDMFYMFIRKKKTNMANYDAVEWQKYFRNYAQFRTICMECQNTIEKFHADFRKQLRLKERRKNKDLMGNEDSDSQDEIQDDSVNFEKRKIKVRNISENARNVIRSWIKKARDGIKERKSLQPVKRVAQKLNEELFDNDEEKEDHSQGKKSNYSYYGMEEESKGDGITY